MMDVDPPTPLHEPLVQLLKWAKERGATAPKMSLDPTDSRRFLAAAPIAAQEPIITLPQHLLMHAGVALDDPVYGRAFRALKAEMDDVRSSQHELIPRLDERLKEDAAGGVSSVQLDAAVGDLANTHDASTGSATARKLETAAAAAVSAAATAAATMGCGEAAAAMEAASAAAATPSVPQSYWDSGGLSDRDMLCMLLILERARGAASEWAPYINILPAEYDDPAWWDAASLALLRGTRVARAAAAYQPGLERLAAAMRRLRELHARLGSCCGDGAPKPGAHDLEATVEAVVEQGDRAANDILAGWACGLDAARWARSAVWSRSFTVRRLKRTATPPAALESKMAKTRAETGQQLVEEVAAAEEPERPYTVCQVPVLDMIDHQPGCVVAWHTGPEGQDDFVWLKMGGVEQGAVLYNNYGSKDNQELLLAYGFVLSPNPYDYVSLSLKHETALAPDDGRVGGSAAGGGNPDGAASTAVGAGNAAAEGGDNRGGSDSAGGDSCFPLSGGSKRSANDNGCLDGRVVEAAAAPGVDGRPEAMEAEQQAGMDGGGKEEEDEEDETEEDDDEETEVLQTAAEAVQRRLVAAAAGLPSKFKLTLEEPLPEALLQAARVALASGPRLYFAAAEAVTPPPLTLPATPSAAAAAELPDMAAAAAFAATSAPASTSAVQELLQPYDTVSELRVLSTVRQQLDVRLAAMVSSEGEVRQLLSLPSPPPPAPAAPLLLLLPEDGWRQQPEHGGEVDERTAAGAASAAARSAAPGFQDWLAEQGAVAERLGVGRHARLALAVVNGQRAILLAARRAVVERVVRLVQDACSAAANTSFCGEGILAAAEAAANSPNATNAMGTAAGRSNAAKLEAAAATVCTGQHGPTVDLPTPHVAVSVYGSLEQLEELPTVLRLGAEGGGDSDRAVPFTAVGGCPDLPCRIAVLVRRSVAVGDEALRVTLAGCFAAPSAEGLLSRLVALAMQQVAALLGRPAAGEGCSSGRRPEALSEDLLKDPSGGLRSRGGPSGWLLGGEKGPPEVEEGRKEEARATERRPESSPTEQRLLHASASGKREQQQQQQQQQRELLRLLLRHVQPAPALQLLLPPDRLAAACGGGQRRAGAGGLGWESSFLTQLSGSHVGAELEDTARELQESFHAFRESLRETTAAAAAAAAIHAPEQLRTGVDGEAVAAARTEAAVMEALPVAGSPQTWSLASWCPSDAAAFLAAPVPVALWLYGWAHHVVERCAVEVELELEEVRQEALESTAAAVGKAGVFAGAAGSNMRLMVLAPALWVIPKELRGTLLRLECRKLQLEASESLHGDLEPRAHPDVPGQPQSLHLIARATVPLRAGQLFHPATLAHAAACRDSDRVLMQHGPAALMASQTPLPPPAPDLARRGWAAAEAAAAPAPAAEAFSICRTAACRSLELLPGSDDGWRAEKLLLLRSSGLGFCHYMGPGGQGCRLAAAALRLLLLPPPPPQPQTAQAPSCKKRYTAPSAAGATIGPDTAPVDAEAAAAVTLAADARRLALLPPESCAAQQPAAASAANQQLYKRRVNDIGGREDGSAAAGAAVPPLSPPLEQNGSSLDADHTRPRVFATRAGDTAAPAKEQAASQDRPTAAAGAAAGDGPDAADVELLTSARRVVTCLMSLPAKGQVAKGARRTLRQELQAAHTEARAAATAAAPGSSKGTAIAADVPRGGRFPVAAQPDLVSLTAAGLIKYGALYRAVLESWLAELADPSMPGRAGSGAGNGSKKKGKGGGGGGKRRADGVREREDASMEGGEDGGGEGTSSRRRRR